MANRFPLIIDTDDGNKFKELPVGDNLNLQGSSIINASSIEVLGNLDVQSLTVNEQTLSNVAVTGDYNDLSNIPSSFSGSYNDLSNKPDIPTSTKNLTDVSLTDPTDGQILVFNSTAGRFEPTDQTDIDLSTSSINDLQDVITTGATEGKYLKYTSGAWRPGNINYSEIINKPTNVSSFVNDAGYITPAYFASGPNPVPIDATVEFTGDNVHFGLEAFNNRVDFNANVFVAGGPFGSFDVNTDAIVLNGNGSLLLSANGDFALQGIGLFISDPGGGSVIQDATQLSFEGSVDFANATVTNLGDVVLGAVESTSLKTSSIIAPNLDEDVILNVATGDATLRNVSLSKLNISQGTDPASAIGASGDTAGEIRVGTDNASTRYLYYCADDYDGASAIWYRVAMSNNWS